MDRLKTSPSSVDEDLIRAVKSGGLTADTAIMSLYARYRTEVSLIISAFMIRYGHRADEPDDVLHDSFIILLHKIQHEDLVITSLKAFWIGIAKYLLLNQIKKDKKIERVAESEAFYGLVGPSPETTYLHNEKFEELHQCLGKCGNKCQEILLLWLSDYSMTEIAERLHLSGPAMARKIKYECFKKLKKIVMDSHILRP